METSKMQQPMNLQSLSHGNAGSINALPWRRASLKAPSYGCPGTPAPLPPGL